MMLDDEIMERCDDDMIGGGYINDTLTDIAIIPLKWKMLEAE